MAKFMTIYDNGSVKTINNTDVAEMNGSMTGVNYVGFDTTVAYSVLNNGEMTWNADEETLDLKTGGAVLQLGQELHYNVKNQTGSTIPNGTAVMATGALGASGRITVAPMVADGSIPSYLFIGVTTEEILNGADGKVTAFGKVRNIDTHLLNDGDVLWCDPNNAGQFTTTEPTAPNLKLSVAFVVNADNNGTIFVRANEGHSLLMCSDVTISSPDTGQVLIYDATSSSWQNQYPQIGFSVQSVKTTNYTADAWQYVPVDVTSSNITVTLPSATISNGIEVGAKIVGVATNTLRVSATGLETIDGNAFIELTTDNASLIVISNGSNWYVK
jgi:hypothetical protein